MHLGTFHHLCGMPCTSPQCLPLFLTFSIRCVQRATHLVLGHFRYHFPNVSSAQTYLPLADIQIHRPENVVLEFLYTENVSLNVSLLPNVEKTCKQSLVHNWKSNLFSVPVSTIHTCTVTSRDVWRPWHIMLKRDL